MTDEVDESTVEATDTACEPVDTVSDTVDENDDGAVDDGDEEEPHRRTRFAEIANRLEQSPPDASPNSGTDSTTSASDRDEAETVPAVSDNGDFGSWEWFEDDDVDPNKPVSASTQTTGSETTSVDSTAKAPKGVDEPGVTRGESEPTDPDVTGSDENGSEDHGEQRDRDDARSDDRVWSTKVHADQPARSLSDTSQTDPTEPIERKITESKLRGSDESDSKASDSVAESATESEISESDTGQSTDAVGTDDATDRGSVHDTTDDEDSASPDSKSVPPVQSTTTNESADPSPSKRDRGRRLWNRDETSSTASPDTSEFLRGGARSESSNPSNSSDATGALSSQSGDGPTIDSGDDPGTDAETSIDTPNGRSSTRTWRRTEQSDEPGPMETFDDSEAYARPSGFDPQPGTSSLVQCGSQDDRKHAACTDMLGLDTAVEDRNVLLVNYRQIHEGRLEQIASAATRTTLIAIGYAQPVPDSVTDDVKIVQINNPNDITRLGILVSGTVDDWADDTNQETVFCYDSLNVLMEYKDIRSTFRFLHIFLGTLQGADVIAHFHVDPLAGDPQDINTLKPLFDDIVSIDAAGAHLE